MQLMAHDVCVCLCVFVCVCVCARAGASQETNSLCDKARFDVVTEGLEAQALAEEGRLT